MSEREDTPNSTGAKAVLGVLLLLWSCESPSSEASSELDVARTDEPFGLLWVIEDHNSRLMVVTLDEDRRSRLAEAEVARRFSGFDATEASRVAVYVGSSPKHDQRSVALALREGSGGLMLDPRYPWKPGVDYCVVIDDGGERWVQSTRSPDSKPAPNVKVVGIYPSSATLPENQLRFYIQFSHAMSRGEVYDRIELVDEHGTPLELPFLELGEELWDPEMTRITLLLDPARVKRGLVPHEVDGPVLEEGRTYTMRIDPAWRTADGGQLFDAATKTFAVVARDDTQPDPDQWSFGPAANTESDGRPVVVVAGSRTPLEIAFPEPLDWGMLHRAITVTDEDGQRLEGDVAIGSGETRWIFVPTQPWDTGVHRLQIRSNLEDRAGNNLERPFERDVFERFDTSTEPGFVERVFVVEDRAFPRE